MHALAFTSGEGQNSLSLESQSYIFVAAVFRLWVEAPVEYTVFWQSGKSGNSKPATRPTHKLVPEQAVLCGSSIQ